LSSNPTPTADKTTATLVPATAHQTAASTVVNPVTLPKIAALHAKMTEPEAATTVAAILQKSNATTAVNLATLPEPALAHSKTVEAAEIAVEIAAHQAA